MITRTFAIPHQVSHAGLVLARPSGGDGHGQSVIGDPCIVHDESIQGLRMFLFMDPPGHGQAICRSTTDVGPGQWQLLGPLVFTNPSLLVDQSTHKPFVIQHADRPNHAARIQGRYWLVSVGHSPGWVHKYIHRAWSTSLAGPWTWEEEPLIPVGGPGAFDEKHADAVSAFYVPDRDEILYFYMGYPLTAQNRALSPYGNAQGVAVQRPGGPCVKLGEYLAPQPRRGHWASGWIGGMQILPGREHRWIGLLNASPTAPDPRSREVSGEEPPPSLGGFAWCDEAFPVANWHLCDQPLCWIDAIPQAMQAAGEGTNLWRHHALALDDGRLAIFYNSGSYGREQLYLQWAEAR